MTLYDAFALFLIMIALAAIPSSSVVLVVTRSATLDLKNGIAASAGIVAGDLIFMSMAILGMTALSQQMGALFVLIKYMAAAYLIWFGIALLKNQHQRNDFSGAHIAWRYADQLCRRSAAHPGRY